MDFKNILTEIQKADPEVFEKVSPRRHILKSFGSKVAVAALPFALGSLFNKAYGKTTDVISDALNFALELEYLEFNFYNYFTTTGVGIIAAADLAAFQTITMHERDHVSTLIATITSLGATPYTPPNFTGSSTNPVSPASYDLTGGGAFPDIYTNYATFLAVAQTFEDTGVRAYKGQAGNLISNNAVLTAALQIHSVEARHASHIRLIRRKANSDATIKPWITNAIPTVPAVAANYGPGSPAATYPGEDNVSQDGVTITSLSGAVTGTTISMTAASEAFDEPLDSGTVASLVAPFILP